MPIQTVAYTTEITVRVTIGYTETQEGRGDSSVIGGTQTRTVWTDPYIESVEVPDELNIMKQIMAELHSPAIDLLDLLEEGDEE